LITTLNMCFFFVVLQGDFYYYFFFWVRVNAILNMTGAFGSHH
jgi:hypothetical protein